MNTEDKILPLEKLVNNLLSRVSQLEFDNDRLTRENMVLRQENLSLRQENEGLRSRLNKTPQNSHKPPSSSGYSQKPALPKASGKVQGVKERFS
jgi:regulator of replication initiation timing